MQCSAPSLKLKIGPLRFACREAITDALSPLGSLGNGVAGGEGAIYLWAKLPEGQQLFPQWAGTMFVEHTRIMVLPLPD